MTKIYDREAPAFKATLLHPPTDNVLTRLMSPQDRARLTMKQMPKGLLAAALDAAIKQMGTVDEEVIESAVLNYQASVEDSIGKYAYYPADFNYLAHAIGSSPIRYEPWFHNLGGLHLTPGVTTIFAETGAGKTTMADLLAFNMLEQFAADSAKVMRVKLGESGSDLDTFLRFSELAEALPAELPPIIIIDSVRLQTFDMGGASRSLSISNQLFRWLTEIDIFAVGHGVSVILVMNPLAGEEDKIEQFRGDVESSVMAVVNLDSWNKGTFKHRGDLNGRTATPFVIPGEIRRASQPDDLIIEPVSDRDEEATTALVASTAGQRTGRTPYGRVRALQP